MFFVIDLILKDGGKNYMSGLSSWLLSPNIWKDMLARTKAIEELLDLWFFSLL